MHKRVLVIFGDELPKIDQSSYDNVIFGDELKKFTDPGSVYEAAELIKELPKLVMPEGLSVDKSLIYEGFELWWIHYDSIFWRLCLPYTQYRRLLEYLKDFGEVTLYGTPFRSLFACYLGAYGSKAQFIDKRSLNSFLPIPVGAMVQIFLTVLSLVLLSLKRPAALVFIGDKLEKGKDYDFRMGFIYRELREKQIPFVEFIRSIEPSKIILKNFLTRKRAVIYTEAITWITKLVSFRHLDLKISDPRPEKMFRLSLATIYSRNIYQDILAIRVNRFVLKLIGVKSALFTAAMERNFYTVLGCKLENIPTTGILHGVASLYGTPYDFIPGFNGDKQLSVDSYGLWSEWWKERYIKESSAYKPEQLFVSGPMRPLEGKITNDKLQMTNGEKIKVLFIAEQTVMPEEVMPYLHKLLEMKNIRLTIKFRPFRDGFENWLLEHEPEILRRGEVYIVKGGMQEAIQDADVVVGCHSTAVLEALLQLKVPIFLHSRKWGDYYNMVENKRENLFAENPEELVSKLKNIKNIAEQELVELRDQYFGDPYKNGSAWAVEMLEKSL